MKTLLSLSRACLPLLSLLVTACGGGSGGDPNVTGTIGGKSFAAVVAVSSPIDIDYTPAGAIFISSVPGYCGLVTAHEVPQNAEVMNIVLGQYDPSSSAAIAPTKPGTFTIVAPDGEPTANVAQATYAEVGAGCKVTSSAQATSGTVTLDAVDKGAYRGKADLVFDSGDAVTVEFDAQACSAINYLFDSSADPACK